MTATTLSSAPPCPAPAGAAAYPALPPLPEPWQALAGAYLAQVHQRTGSRRTPQEYARYLGRFLQRVDDPSRATAADVHAFAYGAGPSGRVPSPSTVIVRLAALAGFFDFARRMDLVTTNPAEAVKRPRNSQPTPRGLTAAELRRLLAVLPRTRAGLRDRAIILIAVLTGLRRQEIMGLRAGDLTQDGTTAYYHVRAKGGLERHRELPAPAFAALGAALAA